MATGWEKRSKLSVFMGRMLEANSNYIGKMSQVSYWLIEIDDDDIPWRELGVNESHMPVLAGPTESDYGFWHDTNMRYQDFECEVISSAEFESKWIYFWAQNNDKRMKPLN